MTAAFAVARRRPRAALSQRHAGGLLRAVRSGAVPPGGARRARSWRRWSASVDLALGDSEYNRQELESLGFAPTGVLPDRRRHGARHPAGRRPALERCWTTGW